MLLTGQQYDCYATVVGILRVLCVRHGHVIACCLRRVADEVVDNLEWQMKLGRQLFFLKLVVKAVTLNTAVEQGRRLYLVGLAGFVLAPTALIDVHVGPPLRGRADDVQLLGTLHDGLQAGAPRLF